MRDPQFRAPLRARLVSTFALLAAIACAGVSARAQSTPGATPFPNWNPYGQQQAPPPQQQPAAPPATRTPQQRTAPAATASPAVARVGGRVVTQADFDRVAQPYYQRLRRELGGGFNADLQKLAAVNVLDELVRRELLAIEVQRQGVTVTTAEVDSLLAQDPFFNTNGRFDAAKFNAYKTTPGTNYLEVLPRLREAAAVTKLDASLRRRFAPTPAQVREEWNRRNEQVRASAFPLLTRDLSLEPEASDAERADYYRAHPDQFVRRPRARLRFARLPLPVPGDSLRATGEATAMAEARAIADSLRRGVLADTAARFADTGLFEIPAPYVPGIGRLLALTDTLARLEQDSTIRVVGPYVGPEAVYVGAVVERRPREVPPLREVIADVKRRADAEKRRATAEADRRAFHAAHAKRWRTRRVAVTRVTVDSRTLPFKPPGANEVDRWYAQHGRTLFGASDSSRAWLPPISDSLRALARERLVADRRAEAATASMGRVAAGLAGAADARALARSNGAVAETLSFVGGGAPDSLFPRALVDSLLSGSARRGTAQGPRVFGPYVAAWRVDAVDTSFVPPYEQVRGRSDIEFAEERRRLDEADARAWFDQHRGDYRTPDRWALDLIAVRPPAPESLKITDAELRRFYDANAATFRQEEQVRARHILFMTRGAGPDVEARAKLRADSLLAAIRKEGGDFADLARRFSEEPGASSRGGDLGWFGRGRMVREFEEAAFALKPGEISTVVKTQFGYHIIKVEEHRDAGLKPFADVSNDIRLQMVQSRGDSLARRDADGVRRRLAAGGDATALAAPFGGIVAAEPIAASDPLPGLGSAPELAADLPSLVPGRWAAKTYHVGSAWVLVRLREKQPPRPAEFDEVRARALEDLKADRRRALLEGKVAAIRAALAAGASLDSLAAPWGGLKESGPLSASSTFFPQVGAEPRLVQKAFAMQPGEVSDTLQVAQGVVWLRLDEKKTPDVAAFRAAAPVLEAELLRTKYDAWIAERKKAVRVDILRADLRRPTPPAGLGVR